LPQDLWIFPIWMICQEKKNEIGISFPDHIFESPFSLDDKKSKATLRFNNQVESFRIFFETIENYVLVYAFEK
jgi:4'-phosphopantetheinyl transferase